MPRPSKGKVQTIVFTDLDGTLIDFETYSPDISAPLARKLSKKGIPLVFCSSKTLEEQLFLMNNMDLSIPCIIENGCGIYLPANLDLLSAYPSKSISGFGRLVGLGVSILKIQKEIQKLSQEMGVDFRPYSEMTNQAVSRITGLSKESARQAKNREFSETLTASLSDSVWSKVNANLNKVGLQCLCGGRFYTVTSKNCSKGSAMKILIDAYQEKTNRKYRSIGIGDSANDYDMLRTSDHAYLVQRPDESWCEMKIPNINRVDAIGPKGWVKAVRDALTLS